MALNVDIFANSATEPKTKTFDGIEGRMTTDEMLAASNEALYAKAKQGQLGIDTPESVRKMVLDYNKILGQQQLEDENSNMNYLVAGETSKTPEQAHKLEVTPQAIAAFQKAGYDIASERA